MTTVRFHLVSPLSAPELMEILTDFSSARPDAWPTIDAEHFEVHAIGDGWAEVTEGTASAWERARYEWDTEKGRVEITTHDSKVFGPGGGWVFQLSAVEGGTRVDVELTRTPQGAKRKLLAALLPVVAPSSLRKSFARPLQAA
jgi:hypothetical protein